MALSFLAVPVFLETTTSPAQLYHEWARTYHYGHQALPALAVTTFALYAWAAKARREQGWPWHRFLLSGVVTLTMVPFTWIFMTSLNNTLFSLEAQSKALATPVSTLEEAQALLESWSRLHFARSLFPLAGSAIGLMTVLKG